MRFFLTKIEQHLPDGTHRLFLSRAHRKGLLPIHVGRDGVARAAAIIAHPWLHFWAPTRLAWWIGVLFMVGSAHFAVGSLICNWPEWLPAGLANANAGRVFFAGSIFFTTAAALQLLEAINGDIADIKVGAHRRPGWRWVAWKPRNAGFSAAFSQFVGTLLFNVNTAAPLLVGSGWKTQMLWVWIPNLAGCILFLLSSYIALVEVSHGFFSFQPRRIEWWIAIINMAGSVAFMVSALFAFVLPNTGNLVWEWGANLYTLLGAACFFSAAYLMIPELFGAGRGVKTIRRIKDEQGFDNAA